MSETIQTTETTKDKKPLFSIRADGKLSVLIFFVALAIIAVLTFSARYVSVIEIYAVRLSLNILLIIAYTFAAVLAVFLTGRQSALAPTKRRLWLQILIGVGIAAALCFIFGILPVLCGTSLIGSHTDMSAGRLALTAMLDILFVGVGEEIVFRGYIQDQFAVWLKKGKWLAPLIAAAIFGLWHIINGSWFQVLFTTLIGCVFGYSKYLIKNCTLLSVILAHGLYDFSLVLLTCFML